VPASACYSGAGSRRQLSVRPWQEKGPSQVGAGARAQGSGRAGSYLGGAPPALRPRGAAAKQPSSKALQQGLAGTQQCFESCGLSGRGPAAGRTTPLSSESSAAPLKRAKRLIAAAGACGRRAAAGLRPRCAAGGAVAGRSRFLVERPCAGWCCGGPECWRHGWVAKSAGGGVMKQRVLVGDWIIQPGNAWVR
jgi:hypothetical protein